MQVSSRWSHQMSALVQTSNAQSHSKIIQATLHIACGLLQKTSTFYIYIYLNTEQTFASRACPSLICVNTNPEQNMISHISFTYLMYFNVEREILVVKPPQCIHLNFYEQSGWTVGVPLLVSLLGMSFFTRLSGMSRCQTGVLT